MLFKKMLREIRLYLSQFITIFLMVFIGVMAYSGIESYMTGMQKAGDRFYKENNLQDLNVIGTNFTDKDLETVKNIDNVKDVERKLTIQATGEKDQVYNISFIEKNDISKFYIVDGIEFDKNKDGIWVDNFYAEENNLKIKDHIKFKYDGYTFDKEILGFINVPDHLYDTKDESELYPNHKEFAFIYISSNELEEYLKYKILDNKENKNFNYKDYLVFNNMMVDIKDKDKQDKVKEEIENKLENEIGVIKIEDTPSYKVYQGEIDEGKTYVGVFSGLFIFIAMLSVITTMTRIVKKQRVQIGTLKALGFKNKKIIWHYITYALFVSVLGSIAGLFGGYFLIGKLFMGLEMSFFEVPNGVPVFNISCYIVSILTVLIVVLVTYLSTHKNLKEVPAKILRNDVINNTNNKQDITTKKIFNKLSFQTKWNLRDMFRNKIRTITAIAGITGCCMLIVCALGMKDSMNNFVKIQFEDLCNFNYKLSIKEDTKEEDINKLVEEYKNTSMTNLIEIDINNKKESNNIFIDDSNNKIRFIDNKNNFIKLNNNEGVYITYKLKEQYNLELGDYITWHIMGNDKYYKSKIVGFNKDPQNQNITMTRKYYESLGNKYIPNFIYTDKDLSKVKEIKNIELIQDIEKLTNGMEKMLATNKTMVTLIIFIAVVLGIVIIYNMTILSYTEKEYQYATLKVLGFNDKKIKKIFIKENNIITTISIILGLPLGYLLIVWLFKSALEKSFDISAYVKLTSYLLAIIGTYLTTYIVSIHLSRKVNKIDMVSSLKGNE